MNLSADLQQLPLPISNDLLLLKSCLSDENARESYQQWRNKVDFETEVGRGAFRLLPLLYFKQRQNFPSDEIMGRLKGIYRNSWSTNNLLLFSATPALTALKENGVELLLLKGLPLAQLYYKNMALRPMADIDILVRSENKRKAVEVLQANGFQIKEDAPLHYIFRALRSITMVKDQLEIDLHWSPLIESFGLKKEHLFWEHTQPIEVGGCQLRTLDTTGHFFHCIVHGFKRNPEPPIRWIADAVYLLKSPEPINWNRLWQLGQQHSVLMQLKQAFQFLKEDLAQPIPTAIMERLEALKPKYGEKLLYQYALTDGWQFEAPETFQQTVRMHYYLHLRKSAHQPFAIQNFTFIGYTFKLIFDTPTFFFSRFSALLFKALGAKK